MQPKSAEQIEREYMEFCASVRRDAMRIVGLAGAGRTDDAGIAAAELAQKALTQQNQYRMQQEAFAGSYDLSALRVDVASASNSETGFEDRG